MTKTQKLDFLLALYITCVVSAELLGSKIFTLFGINASVAIFVFPITFVINDIVTEVEGKKRALNFMRSALHVLIFLAFFTTLALILPPATRFAETNTAYVQVFSKSLRITLASLAAFFIAEKFDIYIFAKIRKKLGKKKFWLRSNISNISSQFFDTSIFMFLAFYRPGNFWFICSLILPYWLLKSAFSVLETPFAYWGVRWLKKPGVKNK